MRSGRRVVARWTGKAGLAAVAALALLPFYVLVVTATKPFAEAVGTSILTPPGQPTLEPLLRAWSSACIGGSCEGLRSGILTSLAIAVPASCLSTALGLVNGYALTRWRVRGADLAFVLLLVANLLPYQLVLLPVAITLRLSGLFGTVEGLILVHVAYGMPYVTLLFRGFLLGLPADVIYAARMDGARFWSVLRHVVVPMSWPMIGAVLILQFSAIWNDYLFGLVFGGRGPPATVMLNNLVNGAGPGRELNLDMAAVLLTALPPLLLYVFAGRLILAGVTAGPRG